MIRHINTTAVGSGPGFSDLLADGAGGYYALRAGDAGLEWRAGPDLVLQGQSGISGSGALDAPRRLTRDQIDGDDVLLISGRYGRDIEGVRLTGDGGFGARFTLTMDGATPAAPTTLAAANGLYVTATRQEAGLSIWERDGLDLRVSAGNVAADLLAPGDVSDLALAEIAGQTRLLVLSGGGDRLLNIALSPAGEVQGITELGVEDGLFLDQPGQMQIISVAGQDYALIGALGSGSIAVVALGSDGQMTLTDHVGDDQVTRFGGVTVLDALVLEGQVFVLAGGADDGLSLMTLLPGGRLLHLDTLVHDTETALENPHALSLRAQPDGLEVVVAGGTASGAPGLSLLQIGTGSIGVTRHLGDGDDLQNGTAAQDQIVGGAGDDTLRGARGADVLVDGAGSDVLEGGAGADTFVFLRDGAEDRVTDFEPGLDRLDLSDWGRFYTTDALEITPTASGARIEFGTERLWLDTVDNTVLEPDELEITDLRDLWRLSLNPPEETPPQPPDPPRSLTGTDGPDLLQGGSGADRLTGDPGDPEFDALSGQVFRLYQAVFDRAPDMGGFFDWMDRLGSGAVTSTEAAERFVLSAEFQQTYGALETDEFVTLLYQNVLGRQPDPVGFADWTGRLESGALSRAEVVLRFTESREFVAATTEAAQQFSLVGLQVRFSDDVFRLYQATLGRAPDPIGFRSWTEELASGTPFVDVIAGFTGSIEFRQTYGQTSDLEFVTLLYANVLERGPDPTGLADWLNRLATQGWSREDVVAAFAQSREFVERTASDLIAWGRARGPDDVLEGGAGDDVLTGGILSDSFVFSADAPGRDVVLDFEPWDRLEFRGFGYAMPEDARDRMVQVGADVLFDDRGVQVVVQNTLLEEITF